MRTFALTTLGCKVNQYEGESIRNQLSAWQQVAFEEPADLYIINGCGVTAEAEAKARQLIGRARKTAPGARLVFTGCYRPEEERRLAALGVDLFIKNSQKRIFSDLIGDFPGAKSTGKRENVARPTRTRVFVKVQDGCDQHCSYCAIPRFRPKPISRPLPEVVDEIQALSDRGVAEIVLTGIHLGKYGNDFGGGPDLTDLVGEILAGTSLQRLRLSSIEPLEITDRLIELMAAEDRLANHLHLPLQSGSDSILRAMNRPYTAGGFMNVLAKVRGAVEHVAITTDIMVGFPGESAADFAATMALVESDAFSRLHVFKFSARPGTPAAEFTKQIEAETKNDRATTVREAGQIASARFAGRFANTIVSVVTEPEKNGVQTGLTGEYVRVNFRGPVMPAGRIVRTWVEGSEYEFLIGRIYDE